MREKDPALEAALERMVVDERVIAIELPPFGAWIVMETLQMALTHPGVAAMSVVRDTCAYIAQMLENRLISLYPDLKEEAEKGWHRSGRP